MRKLPHKFVKKSMHGVLAMSLIMSAFTGCGVSQTAATSGEPEKDSFSLYGGDKDESDESAHDEESDSMDSNSEGFDTKSGEVADKTAEIEKLIDNYFYFDQDDEKREESYYDGIMRGLDDPYSVYYTKKEYEKMMEDDSGSFEGIGATVSKNLNQGTIYIVKPLEGSPAEKAGLLPNDIVVAVDDLEITTDMELDYVVDHIRGEKGSTVTLKVYREGEEDFLSIKIVRDTIENKTVEYEMLDNNIGYIKVEQFIDNTAGLYKEAVDSLQSQGAKGLVIDMRDNPGGIVPVVLEMVDYMVDDEAIAEGATEKGLLLETKNKDDKVMDRIDCSDGHKVDLPMVVLVNGNSASAAEIFTGCLRDYKLAKVVGTTTYGKGIVQSVMKLSDGSAIKITIAKYFLPSGDDIHKKGVDPDFEVELDESLRQKVTIEHDEDNQLQEALKHLND
ncbi:carboxyl-terminal processing protease [Lachnospiraceae bacterium]|nr:carboxyl-terminal processing protease [Lachnospiraceae bacterium]